MPIMLIPFLAIVPPAPAFAADSLHLWIKVEILLEEIEIIYPSEAQKHNSWPDTDLHPSWVVRGTQAWTVPTEPKMIVQEWNWFE